MPLFYHLCYFQGGKQLLMDFNQWNIIWTLSFGVVAAIAVAGNVFTIIIFLKIRFRKRHHFLLISLAVADLLVGLLSVPLHVTIQCVYYEYNSHVLHVITDWTDMFTGFTSIFTLAVISLERMYAIGWPFRHRALNTRAYVIAIAAPWIIAFTMATAEIILQYVVILPVSFIVLLFTCLSTPLVLTSTAYSVLWMKERSRLMPRQVQEARDLKLAKTVGLITGAFLVTWLPFQIIFLVFNLCVSCRNVSPLLIYIIKLLQYVNSIVNIVIYPVRNVDYRTSLLRMLSACKCCCHTHQVGLSASVEASAISLVIVVHDAPANSTDCQKTTRF